jgi:hypothetical protein
MQWQQSREMPHVSPGTKGPGQFEESTGRGKGPRRHSRLAKFQQSEMATEKTNNKGEQRAGFSLVETSLIRRFSTIRECILYYVSGPSLQADQSGTVLYGRPCARAESVLDDPQQNTNEMDQAILDRIESIDTDRHEFIPEIKLLHSCRSHYS